MGSMGHSRTPSNVHSNFLKDLKISQRVGMTGYTSPVQSVRSSTVYSEALQFIFSSGKIGIKLIALFDPIQESIVKI